MLQHKLLIPKPTLRPILTQVLQVLISQIHENSGWLQSWFSIIPMGFGNTVALQTMLIALLAHIPESHMAIGTGFGQLFRGIGQVGGVAISAAIFQWKLDSALRERIHDPDTEKIPEKDLDSRPRSNSAPPLPPPTAIPSSSLTSKNCNEEEEEEQERGFSQEQSTSTTPDSEMSETDTFFPVSSSPTMMPNRKCRVSTFESTEGILDLESRRIGGSARTGTSLMD
ncbi:hypothetical protein EV359DRAFT_87740 [Lentinula novae-zelandiae]|nr:hypothetical protein EV359DRAFT_87740 [Lentinula novae-zelandiae]